MLSSFLCYVRSGPPEMKNRGAQNSIDRGLFFAMFVCVEFLIKILMTVDFCMFHDGPGWVSVDEVCY